MSVPKCSKLSWKLNRLMEDEEAHPHVSLTDFSGKECGLHLVHVELHTHTEKGQGAEEDMLVRLF